MWRDGERERGGESERERSHFLPCLLNEENDGSCRRSTQMKKLLKRQHPSAFTSTHTKKIHLEEIILKNIKRFEAVNPDLCHVDSRVI